MTEWLSRSLGVVMNRAMVRCCMGMMPMMMAVSGMVRACISGLRCAGQKRCRDDQQNDAQNVFHGKSPKT
jgi:hypothetical protein